MKKMFMAILFANLFFTATTFAQGKACPNGAILNPGTLAIDCSVTVPAKSPKPQTLHYEVDASKLLGGFDIEVPVTVQNPQDFDTQAYEYNVTATNSSNNCAYPSKQQLMLVLSQRQPFCNPPVLAGDSRRQTCSFPEDTEDLRASDLKPAQDGQTLNISAANSHLAVTCSATFKVAPIRLLENNCGFHLSEPECVSDSNCHWVKTAFPACYPNRG
jgi:hypothetical protein